MVREYSVKWWDALKIDPIINQVNKDFPPLVPRSIKTRSQMNLESISIDGKSKKDINDLANQLRLQASQKEDEEISPTSSKASTSHPALSTSQDAQDPYADYDLGSD